MSKIMMFSDFCTICEFRLTAKIELCRIVRTRNSDVSRGPCVFGTDLKSLKLPKGERRNMNMEDIKFSGIVYMLRVYSIMKYKKAIENPLWKPSHASSHFVAPYFQC